MKKKKDSMKLKDLLSERAFDGMSMIGNHASPINATGRDFGKKNAVTEEGGTLSYPTAAEFKAYMKKNPPRKLYSRISGNGKDAELQYDANQAYVYSHGKLIFKGDAEKAYTLYRKIEHKRK
jgi:hypothetical protein